MMIALNLWETRALRFFILSAALVDILTEIFFVKLGLKIWTSFIGQFIHPVRGKGMGG